MDDEAKSSKEDYSRKNEQELGKHLKRHLENWREILLHVNSVLMWEKPVYPGILVTVITLIFMILWYFEPSILTTLSLVGIITCVLDYAVPLISANIFDSTKWTGIQEHKFEEICRNLVHVKQQTQDTWDCVNKMKQAKPKMYFVGILGVLVFTAWIGNLVDNLFLTYLVILVVTLLPGLKHNSVMQQYTNQALLLIKGVVAQKKKN